MNHVAFFRNLNLGRPHCPSRAQFEEAFTLAGASQAASFLTNGTLVFAARSPAQARKIVAAASQTLAASCGLKEPAFLRPLDHLAALVRSDPFAGIDREQVYECCVSFLHSQAHWPASASPPESTRSESADGNVRVLSCTDGEVFSLSFKPGKTPGSPNALLEKRLGLPATTRAWNTVCRLVAKFGTTPE